MGMRLRVRSRGFGWLGLGGIIAAGCSSDYFVETPPPLVPDAGIGAVSSAGTAGFPGKGEFPGKGGSPGITSPDTRPVVSPEHQPPAISGGTLLALREGGRMVVSDPDRDRVSFVDVENEWVEATVSLDEGDEPGRVVEGDGEAHVLLRGTGEVLTVSLATHAIVSRRRVCKAPRGLVYNEDDDTLIVACLEGRLVELPASDGEALRSVKTETDLRDLVYSDGRLLVTRFRSAEVLELDADLAVVKRFTLGQNDGFSPSVAWRAVPGPNGSVIVSHQRGTSARIAIADDPPTAAGGAEGDPQVDDPVAGIGGSGGSDGEVSVPVPDVSGYGSGFDPCAGIVESAVSMLAPDGSVISSGRVAGSVLPVDIAYGPTGQIAIVNAGTRDLDQSGSSTTESVLVFTQDTLDQRSTGSCTFADVMSDIGSQPLGVTFDSKSGDLVVQTREPATLTLYTEEGLMRTIALGGVSVVETGHEIFHRDTGGGIACASCHPEGTDDGRVWTFTGIGARRTQPLDVKLEGSAPFHWGGEFENLESLVGDVLVGRMGGTPQSQERVEALESFLYQLRPRPGVREADDAAALRGKKLFESESTACTDCHQGSTFSTFRSVDIGKGIAMQVPSLLGVSTRTPLMHDGCAETLLDRFDPDCGGNLHGDFADLEATELDDLVAYLETL
jgi:hypothetical protein